MSRYELFLDESGDFFETSTDHRERAKAARGGRVFPSQIAGVLAPAGRFTEQWASTRLAELKASIGLSVGSELHAKEHDGVVVSRLVGDTVSLFEDQGLQPVRIVNMEGVSYGNKQLIYVSMLAELALRICAALARAGERRVELDIVAAKVFLDSAEPGGPPRMIPGASYDGAIQQILGFQAVQRGNAGASRGWRIAEVQLRHAADDPRLQFCDVISNASKSNFSKVSLSAAQQLRSAFGEYDFTMSLPPLLQYVDSLLQDGYLGIAICAIAQRLVGPDSGVEDAFTEDPGTRRVLHERLTELLDRLAEMDAALRTAHLQLVTSWLHQLIDGRLTLAAGGRLARWMKERVGEGLERRVADPMEVEWFTYACARWMLTAANHLGDLESAAIASRELGGRTSRLAGRWEHATLLIDAMVARAVHLTDAWEATEAGRQMRLVDDYYAQLGSLFSAAMPSLFPEEIRSDLRARALGTWVQAETSASAHDKTHLAEARRISDTALREFEAQADVRRQYQYRSHIEALAGDWTASQSYLACGTGLQPTASLEEIVSHILRLEPAEQGFPLLHLVRLLARRSIEGSVDDRRCVAGVLRSSRILTTSRWLAAGETEFVEFPRHGILRHAAVAAAIAEGYSSGVQLISILRRLVDMRTGPLALLTIVLAGLTEVGLEGAATQEDTAPRLLGEGKSDRPGALRFAAVLKERATRCGFQTMAARAGQWEEYLAAVAQHPANSRYRISLLLLARAVS